MANHKEAVTYAVDTNTGNLVAFIRPPVDACEKCGSTLSLRPYGECDEWLCNCCIEELRQENSLYFQFIVDYYFKKYRHAHYLKFCKPEQFINKEG